MSETIAKTLAIMDALCAVTLVTNTDTRLSITPIVMSEGLAKMSVPLLMS